MSVNNIHVSKLINVFEKKDNSAEKISINYATTIKQLEEIFKTRTSTPENDAKFYAILDNNIKEMDFPTATKLYDWVLCYASGYNQQYTAYLLAHMNFHGYGVNKDEKRAIAYYTTAYDANGSFSDAIAYYANGSFSDAFANK